MSERGLATLGATVADVLREQREHHPCRGCGRDTPGWWCVACHAADDLRRARSDVDGRTGALRRALPPWRWARIGDPTWLARVPDRRLRQLAERWTPTSGSVLLSGPSGAGKTSACVALAWRLLGEACEAGDVEHVACSAAWVSALDLADDWRRSQYDREGSPLAHAQRARVVVLDELGQEDARPAWLLELVEPRYQRGAPTITTTGLRLADLTDRYGSGAVRRLVEPGGTIIDLWGAST